MSNPFKAKLMNAIPWLERGGDVIGLVLSMERVQKVLEDYLGEKANRALQKEGNYRSFAQACQMLAERKGKRAFDKITDILEELRPNQDRQEYFVMQVALVGTTLEESVQFLEFLATLDKDEALHFLCDVDFTQKPDSELKPIIEGLKDTATKVEARTAALKAKRQSSWLGKLIR